MGQQTKIAWCDHTFNAWWGCTKLPGRPACDNCYAEVLARAYGWHVWGDQAARRFLTDKYWQQPLKWDRAAEKAGVRRRVFAENMGDLFEDRAELVGRRMQLFELVRKTPNLDWLFLTKRIANAPAMLPAAWIYGDWPENVWMGITVENQEVANRDIPILLERFYMAPVLLVSMEPLLGSVDYLKAYGFRSKADDKIYSELDWIIIGCESGSRRRPTDIQHARDLVAMARGDMLPVFIKQLEINGHVETDSRKWPEDLRVQEFPEVIDVS
jgi:protein gp37